MPIRGIGARRARVALALVVAVTVIGVAARVTTSAAATAPPATLVQAAGCDHAQPPPEAPPTAVAAGASTSAAPITVFIPPTVFIRVDGHGAPTALMTNTGCAPRPSDRVLVETDPTHAIGASAALVEKVRALTFSGDWRQTGGWHET
jgi:hypothetical protein